METSARTTSTQPTFSITKGAPSANELAALAMVVTATAVDETPETTNNRVAGARRASGWGLPIDKFNAIPGPALHGVTYC